MTPVSLTHSVDIVANSASLCDEDSVDNSLDNLEEQRRNSTGSRKTIRKSAFMTKKQNVLVMIEPFTIQKQPK